MNFSSRLFRAAGVAVLAGLAVISQAASPAASFDVSSGSPSAGAAAQFTDASSGGAASWLWTFGDGTTATVRSPAHVFPAAGFYPVTLQVTDASGAVTQTTQTLEILPAGTLRLMARTGRAFDIAIQATDPESGDAGPGQAVAQSDAFGYFALPQRAGAMPGAPLTPEVFVKMQDARAQGKDFWVFWGGLTDLKYTLTIRDTVSGVTKVMGSPAPGSPAGMGIDTTGFQAAAAEREVNVGSGGSQFVDTVSGTRNTTVKVGDTVKWTWVSGPHSTTAGSCKGGGGYYGGEADCTGSGVWDSNSHSAGYVYTQTFMTPGTYNYYCAVHGSAMTGSVVVNAADPETTQTPVPPTPTQGSTTPGPVVNADREPVEHVQDRQRDGRLVGRPSPNTGTVATATPTVPGPTVTPTPTPTPPTSSTRVVEIRSDFFRDRVSLTAVTTIDVGTKVEWEWESGSHSTTSGNCCTGDGKWNSGTKSNGNFDHTFVEADRGQTFPYFCMVHGQMMTGTVIVNP